MPEKDVEVKSRLGREMIRTAEYLIDNAFFDDLRKLAKGLGKEYIATDLIVRRIIERDFLAMGFSPYKMNLDRYVVIAKLKEMPRDNDEFTKLVGTLPYNPWLRYAGIQAIPKKTLIATYTVPAGSDENKIMAEIESHPAIDRGEGIELYRFEYTFYTKPMDFNIWFRNGVIRTMRDARKLIEEYVLRKRPRLELREFVGRREDPMDIEDVIVMSYLEYKYVVTPTWAYRIKGGLKIGTTTVKYHFKRHIKNRYYLGIYLKRPPNPEVLDTVVIIIARGKGVEYFSYMLSRTPYALAFCNYDQHKCIVQFFCDERDLSYIVDELLPTHGISIEKTIITFKKDDPPKFHERRMLSFSTYSINARRWYDLDTAIERAPYVTEKVIKKYIKTNRIPREDLYIPKNHETPEKS
jgi:hypothetical protein